VPLVATLCFHSLEVTFIIVLDQAKMEKIDTFNYTKIKKLLHIKDIRRLEEDICHKSYF